MKTLFFILIITFFSCETKNISISKEEVLYKVIKIEIFDNKCKVFLKTKVKNKKYHEELTFLRDCRLNLSVGDELFFTPIIVSKYD